MATLQNFSYTPQSQPLPPISSQQSLSTQTPPPISDNGFPMLAIAILGITATAFLLISYYIFVTKCCFRWQQIDPLRRFSLRRRPHINEEPLTSYSPSWQSRGLNELLIRELPTFQYSKQELLQGSSGSLSKCVVCLNEFQEGDILRVLPKCSHAFHLDCVDVWLQSNSNCPLCRSAISGRNRYRLERIVAPNSSPQEPQPLVGNIVGGDEDFVVIEVSGEFGRTGGGQSERGGESSRFLVQSRTHSSRKFDQQKINSKSKPRKSHHVSIMGDEGINVREKDDQFCIQPIRRSFSMDSASDRRMYQSVQEILRENRQQMTEVSNNGESSSRSRRSIFSFGHGRGSRNAVLPVGF